MVYFLLQGMGVTPANALIGLNNRWGNWTAGDFFSPDEELLQTLNNTEDFNFRYMTVDAQTYSLEPSLIETSQDIKYAICQRYGPIVCYDPLPLPTANMSFTWNNKRVLGEGAATYR
ncbi:uncharacterized protein LOC122242751 [Penaeus japonicus]|uniref:uncharacterized protein LOC122242751 n=1 Tax=Penaeus japonicus TaxID=27405 RepID=UPI001C714247|nr:uncharacterized protein LOC122242751 [Penaeus japonicus]